MSGNWAARDVMLPSVRCDHLTDDAEHLCWGCRTEYQHYAGRKRGVFYSHLPGSCLAERTPPMAVGEKAYQKSAELVDQQTRARRKSEKERMNVPYGKWTPFPNKTPRQVWDTIGATWASVDKTRVKGSPIPSADLKGKVGAEDIYLDQLTVEARRHQWRQWAKNPPNVHQGNALPMRGEMAGSEASPLEYLPERMKVRYTTEGGNLGRVVAAKSLGIHNEGTPHYGVSNGMGGSFGERRNANGEWTCGRGRATVHGGARSGTPPSGEGLDAIFEQEKVVALAEYDWRHAKGKKKEQARHHLHVQRRKLQQMQAERRNRGLMHSARTFESFNASKSTRGQARAEAIKQEDGKPQARL